MLVHDINITGEDIRYAEKILLKEGQTFEDEHNERIDFIKDLTTLDLQAVPGSGKTTVLLAKLLILERYLPFDDGSGILVISHTNTAINEIKDRIGKYCPKLFSYPNFIGTIQSFINKFLVNPYYKNHMKQKLAYIDTEIYENMLISEFKKVKWNNPPKLGQWLYMRNGQNDERVYEVIKNIYYDFDNNEVRDINTDARLIASTNPKHELLESIVFQVLLNGVLSYKYAYKLANYYIEDFPKIIDILRKRFSFVCIDEMQDMDKLQYDLLEKLFFESGSETIFQRIGDKNQAIYNGGNIETDVIWEDREKVLNLTGTNRFSQTIATFVQNFGITHVLINSLQNYSEDFKPHIFKYSDDNIQEIIPKYSQLIKSYVEEGKLQINETKPFKAIAWRKEHDTHIALKSYFEDFEQSQHKVKENYENLKSYLVYFERGNNSFKGIRKSILNAIIKILKLENVKDENDRLYTRKSLINVLKEKQKEEQNNIYDDFNLNIYKWCKSLLVSNDVDSIFNQIKQYIPAFLNIFGKSIVTSRVFITNETLDESSTSNSTEIKNIYNQDGIDIHISTVHSVKGETHTATLYLESFYHSEYESQRLLEQFKNIPFNNSASRHIQSVKMAYVGFSRPSHLLCIAIHEDRFCDSLSESGCYEIINV